MKNEHLYGARREQQRRALRNPRGTTANRAARRECESPIGPPCGARREYRRRALRTPRGTTATPVARRERENPIGLPCGARREYRRRALRNPRGTAGARKSDRATLRRTARM